MSQPLLRFLHSEESLVASKLALFRRLSTSELVASLRPGLPDSLKTRPDGTVLNRHHRLVVLRDRGEDVDALPREVLLKESPEGREQ